MKNKYWEDELQEALKSMKPERPPLDLRNRVMQQVHIEASRQQAAVRHLLSATVRKSIIIALPLLMIVAFLLTKGETNPGTIFGLKPIKLPNFGIPDFTNRLSETLKQALLAISMFAFVQVIIIGRLMRKTDQRLH
jgi:MFS superfamily sulfate permease-like transporter